MTNRRVNALENVTIPRMETVISYINRELDELERYDKFIALVVLALSFSSSWPFSPATHRHV